MSEFDNEDWYTMYASALLNLEHALTTGRIGDARGAITSRLEALREIPGLHGNERHAISDALRTLLFLEKEEHNYQADEKRKALAHALNQLRSIGPAIRKTA